MTPDETSKKAKISAPVKRSRKASKAPVSKAAVVAPVSVSVSVSGKPQVLGAELKKKELIDLVVEKSGISKRDAKPVIEAMLEVLGETIAEGREMNLQPLGKVKYNRIKEMDNARIVILKLRQNKVAALGVKDTGEGAGG